MGFWRTKRGRIGDSWADALDDCMKKLETLKAKSYKDIGGVHLDSDDGTGHEITMQEFADLVEFCSRGHIVAKVCYPDIDGQRPLSQLHDKGVETYPNRGQIHCPELCNDKKLEYCGASMSSSTTVCEGS